MKVLAVPVVVILVAALTVSVVRGGRLREELDASHARERKDVADWFDGERHRRGFCGTMAAQLVHAIHRPNQSAPLDENYLRAYGTVSAYCIGNERTDAIFLNGISNEDSPSTINWFLLNLQVELASVEGATDDVQRLLRRP
jgi:hypothetical protein